jgi:hypothetical protein
MSNKIENNCTPETGQDTTLAYLVGKAESCAPRIAELRHQIEGVICRLTGPSEAPPAEEE